MLCRAGPRALLLSHRLGLTRVFASITAAELSRNSKTVFLCLSLHVCICVYTAQVRKGFCPNTKDQDQAVGVWLWVRKLQ